MGPFGSDIKVDNFIEAGVPVLNGSNLSEYKLIENSFKYVSEEKANTFKKAIARRGDIVITHRGTLGQVSFIPENSKYDRYIISQSQFRVRFNDKKVDPRFIVYLFHTEYGQKKLLSFKNHVGVPALAQATSNFKRLELNLPDISSQQKIASVLSILDQKIEANCKINDNLEQMVKTIYDYWFVQFDFPNEEGKPFKSSGGEMVYNEELRRKIPKGFQKGAVSDLGEVVGGSTPPREIEEYFTTNGTAWITPKDLSQNKGNKFIVKGELDVSDKGLKIASLKIMPKGTVLLSTRAPIGYLAISQGKVTTNQGFKSFIPNKGFSTEYIYYSIKNLIPTIESNAVGSTFKEISASTLKSIPICLPPNEIIKAYNKVITPFFHKQTTLENQNQELTKIKALVIAYADEWASNS